jgi:hypothetical protein
VVTELDARLDLAEKLPEWDMQALRGQVAILQSQIGYMQKSVYERFQTLCEKLRTRTQAVMPSS